MGNFKKVKLYFESTGYIYTFDENDIEDWEDRISDERVVKVNKIEVLEEYELTSKQLKYVASENYDPKMQKELDRTIKIQKREKKISTIIDK
jgi:hypothetical protein